MSVGDEALRAGDLLAVLRRASHEELWSIVEALGRSVDVRIKGDPRFLACKHDLTRMPNVIADHLCRAGGHGVANAWRRGGPSYPEVLCSVCSLMSVCVPSGAGPVATEEALLRQVMERVWMGMTPLQQATVNREGGLLEAVEAAFIEGGATVRAALEPTGPSFRGLAPAVFKVAALRQMLLWSDDDAEGQGMFAA